MSQTDGGGGRRRNNMRGTASSALKQSPAQRERPRNQMTSKQNRQRDVASNGEPISSDAVRQFLETNPHFLNNYVTSGAVSKEVLQKWNQMTPSSNTHNHRHEPVAKKIGHNHSSVKTPNPTDEWEIGNHAQKGRLLMDLSFLQKSESSNEENGASSDNRAAYDALLHQLTTSCVRAVNAAGAHFYLYDYEAQEFFYNDSCRSATSPLTAEQPPNPANRRFKSGGGKTIAAFTAQHERSVRCDNMSKDARFADGALPGIGPVMCHPLIDANSSYVGILELYRAEGSQPFSEKEEETISIILTWGCSVTCFNQAALPDHVHQIFGAMNKQRKLNDFLLNVAKSIFQDIVSMDTVIMKVMNFAQKLVNADRASLFLVDSKSNELYARIFDVGTGDEEHLNIDSKGEREIRFPMDRGIAGHVASTGQILNIDNAYNDDRFNREVDLKTGYKTKTILCMPIYIRGNIIGVVQMVNKLGGEFTKQDEESFETFAIYCGLALHHAKLYDKIRRSEQKHRVALEVLAYHSVSNRDEISKLKKQKMPEQIPELESFYFNAFKLTDIEKPLYAVYMYKDLFGSSGIDYDDLVRFVLTVRKNYRRVPYHNWTHGWSVAHAMYVILKETEKQQLFRPLERLSMYVASLCHDLDHRGKNNAYMKTMSTPLASIYSTSVMEHHHFNQTVTILQQDGHNIFKKLTSDDYKWILSNIKHCILATDLALFFPNKGKLNRFIEEGIISWENEDHRYLIQSVCMTGCDLIASAKPWSIQTDTAKVIFEEFYEQGDAEVQNGREPIAMMDRRKAHELPQMQVGFMKGICLPCYEVLSQVLPCTEALVEKCKYNAIKWQELADEAKAQEKD